ncbi:MAG: hypothetical protein R2774_11985 [Saprospiraceae bacterium]
MSSFRVRPKFEMYTEKSIEDIIQIVKLKLKDNQYDVIGTAMQDHITLQINKKIRHYWSPQLSIIMEENVDNRNETKLIGVYGPMPNVWTIFALSYLAIFTLVIFIAIIGFSQKALGQEAQILYALPFLLATAIALYLISQFGQKLGANHTFALHYFLQEAIGEKVPEI